MSLSENAIKVICYVSAQANYSEIAEAFECDFKNIPLAVHRVAKLPRDALVELEVLAGLK
jgi:enamine deaminase RidA (YjgF/YER057c/UK114 family)